MKKIFLFLGLILVFSCSKKEETDMETNAFYEKAYSFFEKKKYDSAYLYFDKAAGSFEQAKKIHMQGKSLVFMAIISTNNGDNYGGQMLSTKAIKCFDENDQHQYSDIYSNYNNLGISCSNLEDYKNSVRFYTLALKFANEESEKLIALNNLGDTYKSSNDFDKAIKIYENLLENWNGQKNNVYSAILTNLAVSKWKKNSAYNSEPELVEALKIRESENDLWGQNSSYSHLADYFQKNNPEKALQYATKMYEISKKINSPDDKIAALKKIIELDASNYKFYFTEYNKLKDNLQTARNNSKNQFAIIRFDVEKIKRKNAENEVEILKRNIGLGTLSVFLISGFFFYKKRKRENELKIKENQLRLSKRVHDVVANGIYQVMTKIENQEDFDKENALDELEFVYEKSRDISYEKPDAEHDKKDYKKEISSLIASFKNENTQTYTVGNEDEIWTHVSQPVFSEVYQIVRELLVNMKKHSQASRVIFKFEKLNNLIHIQYSDDGIGIPGDMIYKNGLTNTGTRIAAIGGEIIFDNKSEKGLKVNISFPVS